MLTCVYKGVKLLTEGRCRSCKNITLAVEMKSNDGLILILSISLSEDLLLVEMMNEAIHDSAISYIDEIRVGCEEALLLGNFQPIASCVG